MRSHIGIPLGKISYGLRIRGVIRNIKNFLQRNWISGKNGVMEEITD